MNHERAFLLFPADLFGRFEIEADLDLGVALEAPCGVLPLLDCPRMRIVP